MNYLKATLFIFCFFMFQSLVFPQGIEFQESWDTTLVKSQAENKLIFLDAYTVWCGPCKKMDRDVFSQKMVGNFYNKYFINKKLDMEKGVGKELAEKYNVKAFPTLLFLSHDGAVVHQVAGFHNPEEMLALGKQVLDPTSNLASMEDLYSKGNRDPDFLYKYSITRFDMADQSHYPIVDEYLKTQTDWTTEKNINYIFNYGADSNTTAFPFMVRNKEAFYTYFDKKIIDKKVNEMIYDKIYNQEDKPSLPRVEKILKAAFPEKGPLLFANFKMGYYREAGDRSNYALAAVDRFSKFPCKDAGELNDAADAFSRVIEDEKMLIQATKWAKKSIKLSNEYGNNNTIASLYYKLNKKNKALKYAKRAIAIAQKDGDDFSKTQILMDQIRSME